MSAAARTGEMLGCAAPRTLGPGACILLGLQPHFCPLPCRSRLPRYKYQVWQDSRLGRQKMVRDGLETVLTLVPGEPLG